MKEPERRRVSLLGPVLLIAVGTVLLLNTLGVLDWTVWWTILRLWPIFLIAVGLDLLLGRFSIWGSLLAVVLVVAILAGALWLGGSDSGSGRGLPTEEIRQPLGGAKEVAIMIEPAVGVLRIEALPESANLIEGTIYLGKGEEVTQDYVQSGNRAMLELRAQGGEVWVPFGGGWDERRLWDLGLSPGASLELHTSLAAGDAAMDLTGLALSDLAANMGLGRMEIVLPAEGGYSARIDGAIGVTTIVIPASLGVRVQVDTGMTGRQLPADYQQQADNVYTSPGYPTAEGRVELTVSQAMGLLRIRPAQ